jgi:hypothetical protein
MKRVLNLFVLTRPEQRVVIVLALLLVLGAWFKHHGDLQNPATPLPALQVPALSAPTP